jgi:hypothetical protein
VPFFLMVPLSWSARPSAFLSLLPVSEPPASFMRLLTLSMAPSAQSCLLLLGTSAPFAVGSRRGWLACLLARVLAYAYHLTKRRSKPIRTGAKINAASVPPVKRTAKRMVKQTA